MGILSIRDLVVEYQRRDGRTFQAVSGVSLDIDPGRVLGIVGESGCGKSTLAKAALGLVPTAAGQIVFDGQTVEPLKRGSRPAHLRKLQMVFQDPSSSLNPRRTVGDQIADGLRMIGRRPTADAIGELLERVGLPGDAQQRRPHQFSGGQRQRIALARALSVEPSVIVADEPISALDASAQARIANLLVELATEVGVAIVFISHDLAIVKHIAHDVGVMYLGRLVEIGDAQSIWNAPQHPYTRSLLDAMLTADGAGTLPEPLRGEVPDPADPPSGCPFHTRCPAAFERCPIAMPALLAREGSSAACWLLDEPLAEEGTLRAADPLS
jgi:oligopeptide/dipeptide ABC transporter ATP-binding protein